MFFVGLTSGTIIFNCNAAEKNSFIAGKDSETKAFSGSFYVENKIADKTLLSVDKGAIGFEAKSDIPVLLSKADRKAGLNGLKALFHCSEIRSKNPTATNRNNMLILLNRKYGEIYFSVTNKNFGKVYVKARVRNWKKDQWKRFYFIWDFSTDPIVMQIYVDEKLKSKKIFNKRNKVVSTFMQTPLPYSIQWGALNSGSWPFEGAVSSLFISKQPTLVKQWNEQDGVLFNFDDNLNGAYQDNKVEGHEGVITATAK
jgi:hypothetical protein